MNETIKYLITFAAEINHTTFESVMSRSRTMIDTRARRMSVAVLLSYGMAMIDVAEIFQLSGGTMRAMINKHQDENKVDKNYKSTYLKLRKEYERILEDGKNNNRN